jgi:hypothetical protein
MEVDRQRTANRKERSAMLIKGSQLTSSQRQQVLAAFVHRWTHENAKQTYGGDCPACRQATRDGQITTGVKNPGLMERPLQVWTRAEWHAYHMPLTTDAEWINAHSFHFTADGSRLMANRHHAEPVWMAEATA